MPETPGPEIDALLNDLVAQLRDTLGPELVGVYLYGSLVLGDFDPDISDIDLLAATASDINQEDFRALQQMHTAFTAVHPAWDDRLDIDYVSVGALRALGSRAYTMAVITPGEPFHIIKEADPGWLMNWYLVREHGRTLLGPSPAAVIRPISREEFVQTVREQVGRWPGWINQMRARKQQAYVILTMCRALYTHQYGEQVSKRQAAQWAARELPEWSLLIRSALQWRTAWRDDAVDHAATFPETWRFVQFAVQRISTE